MIRRHVLVTGLVQGVWFRDSCRREALARDVSGWVRNRDDGRVEAVFEGAEADVLAVVGWCDHGPPGARVTAVDTTAEPVVGEVGFAVR